MVVLDLDRVAERPALGLRWPRPCIIIGGAKAAALKGSRDITLVKLYRRAAAATTKALVATILFLFVFKALFYTHGRLLLLESFSIERSGSCLFGYYVLLLAYNALWCQPSWLNVGDAAAAAAVALLLPCRGMHLIVANSTYLASTLRSTTLSWPSFASQHISLPSLQTTYTPTGNSRVRWTNGSRQRAQFLKTGESLRVPKGTTFSSRLLWL